MKKDLERSAPRPPAPATTAATTAAPDPRWIRHRPDGQQNLTALAAGIGVGLLVGGAVFYLGRLLLSREPIAPAPSRGAREV